MPHDEYNMKYHGLRPVDYVTFLRLMAMPLDCWPAAARAMAEKRVREQGLCSEVLAAVAADVAKGKMDT